MPRPNRLHEQRRELLPVVAQTFAELGYRRTTSAELAARCGVRENILYRLWPTKKAMFIAAIGAVYELTVECWRGVLERPEDGGSAAHRLLEYEARHLGRSGQYRIIFAGLNETDDREIRAALADMYRRFHAFVRDRMLEHRGGSKRSARAAAESLAWAIVGLGTVTSITRELRLLDDAARRTLMTSIGGRLLDEATSNPRHRRGAPRRRRSPATSAP